MAQCFNRTWFMMSTLIAMMVVRQPTSEKKVSGGILRGTVARDGSHRHYLAIPYATFIKRFEPAGPEPTWDGVLDLPEYHETMRCTQRVTPNFVQGQEDCLILNVYTPLEDSKVLLPVMVFFHGGGFRDGSGSRLLYGPEFLVQRNVILVTVNYRLELLGFLCLDIKEAPGNAGMKDQVQALKWVKRNIRAFGGDPDNVTIFGESAGSASVNYHLLSNMSKGLFHKAIMQSGSALSPWAYQHDPLKMASSLAKQMGLESKDPYEIYNFFMNKTDVELLTARIPREEGNIVISETSFVPCLEKESISTERFLTDTPYNLMKNGQINSVPMIMGFNNAEGLMFLGKENETTLSKLQIHKSLPRDLKLDDKERKIIGDIIKKSYMGEDEISPKTFTKFSKYVGDMSVTYPVVASIDIFFDNVKDNMYLYKFIKDGCLNIPKLIIPHLRKEKGASHADELFYMFQTYLPLPIHWLEIKTINTMVTFWTNFAKYSNPTPESTSDLPIIWEPATKNKQTLLEIGDFSYKINMNWREERFQMWDEIYSKYRRKV